MVVVVVVVVVLLSMCVVCETRYRVSSVCQGGREGSMCVLLLLKLLEKCVCVCVYVCV